MKTEKILLIPLVDIITNGAIQNARSGVIEDASGVDPVTGIEEDFRTFQNSLARGQKTPVIVRKSEGHPDKYELIAGFRRYAALNRLFEAGQDEDGRVPCPTIKAICREGMNEFDARLENISENIERTAMTAPDTAWALQDLKERWLLCNPGKDIADKDLGSIVGKSQSYSQRLLFITGGCSKKVIALWRAASPKESPTIQEMTAIAKLPKGEQVEAFKEAVEAKTPTKRAVKGPSAWFDKRKEELLMLGKVVKLLEDPSHQEDGQWTTETITRLVDMGFMKLGKNSTEQHVLELVGNLTDGYQDGPPPPKEPVLADVKPTKV